MALLYDASGREIYVGGVTREDVIAAIQAAALADEFETAQAIADRHGWTSICLCCAIKSATTAHHDRIGRPWRVCITCFHELNPAPDFSDVKLYAQGLIKRSVV